MNAPAAPLHLADEAALSTRDAVASLRDSAFGAAARARREVDPVEKARWFRVADSLMGKALYREEKGRDYDADFAAGVVRSAMIVYAPTLNARVDAMRANRRAANTVPCDDCEGTGVARGHGYRACPTCHGTRSVVLS